VLATVIGVPLSVAVGWVHLKRSRLFSSEQDISIEANPYNYKTTPGKETELSWPILLLLIRMLRRLVESKGMMTDTEKLEADQLEDKILALLEGRYVGTPRRGTNF
jgi:hypothetical protein